MKFSPKTEDGTSNEPLNFGSDRCPWRRFVLSERRFPLSKSFQFLICDFKFEIGFLTYISIFDREMSTLKT